MATLTQNPLQQAILDRLSRTCRSIDLDPVYAGALVATLDSLWGSTPNSRQNSSPLSLLDLPILCAEAAGGERQAAEEVCIAWALFYAAAHLLDDIEDQDTDKPLFQRLGVGTAINQATGLIFVAETILSDLENFSGLSPSTASELRLSFNRVAISMNGGQHRDLSASEPDLEQCWQVAAAKSGLFFSLGCRAGARTVTGDTKYLEAFGTYGFHLGMLIQIANDMAGLWPSMDGHSDLAFGKLSLPVAYACDVLPAPQKDDLRKILLRAKMDYSAECQARSIIQDCGAQVYLMLKAEKHRLAAQNSITALYLSRAALDALLKIPQILISPAKDGSSPIS